jgi:hypothetical protein
MFLGREEFETIFSGQAFSIRMGGVLTGTMGADDGKFA